MRTPKPIKHPIAEALAYVFIAILAMIVVGHAAKTPLPSDFQVSQGN